MTIRWNDGVFPGDNRLLAMCGKIAIGAVFLPGARGRYFRWRVWCTALMNPCEGSARSLDAAKSEVETRFATFLTLAELESVRNAT